MKTEGDIQVVYETITYEDDLKNSKIKEGYDYVNPNHYKNNGVETWEMMLKIWGEEKFIAHCEMTAFKYRMRIGTKPDQPIERDLEKAKWYEDKIKELRSNKNNI